MKTAEINTVGLIGLGNAGAALAGPLAGQFRTLGFDLNPERRAVVEAQGVQWRDSVALVAEQADLVLLNLPTPESSSAVLDEILNARPLPLMVVETSTITAAAAQRFARRCGDAGVRFVDAAIAGGVAGMAAGETTFLLGGSEADVAVVSPVLQSMAKTLHHVGPTGAGMGTKVIINAVYHAEMVVLLEAYAMAGKLNIPAATLTAILKSPEGILRPLTHRIEQRVMNGDFSGGMSVTNARKDSLLALQTAQDLGVPLYAIQASHTPYEIAQAQGLGDLDYASLAKLWAQWGDDNDAP